MRKADGVAGHGWLALLYYLEKGDTSDASTVIECRQLKFITLRNATYARRTHSDEFTLRSVHHNH